MMAFEWPMQVENCAICGENNVHKISKKGQFGEIVNVVLCKNDGFVYLSPRWNQEGFDNYYGELINASSEFLRDLDFETWQLVAYKSPLFEDKLILRVIGYPGNLRIDHPTDLRVESGRKQWFLDDKTLLNADLSNDGRQAAAEFDLDELIKNLEKNRPLRLSLSGVFSELPVPPFVVKEWRSIN